MEESVSLSIQVHRQRDLWMVEASDKCWNSQGTQDLTKFTLRLAGLTRGTTEFNLDPLNLIPLPEEMLFSALGWDPDSPMTFSDFQIPGIGEWGRGEPNKKQWQKLPGPIE